MYRMVRGEHYGVYLRRALHVERPGVYLPAPSDNQIRNSVRSLGQLAAGHTNSKGSFTLSTAGATSVTVLNVTCGPQSIISWTPVTPDAAAQMATLYCLSSNVTTGQFIVTQSSNTSTSAIFNYVIHS